MAGEKDTSGLGGVARIVLFFFCNAFLLAVVAPLGRNLGGQAGDLLIGTAAAAGSFLLTWVFVRWEGLSLRSAGALFLPGSVVRFALGFAGGLTLVALYTLGTALTAPVHWERVPGMSFTAVAIDFLVFIALACREELSFRGYPLFRLDDLFGLWTAQILVALVFGAEHMLGGLSLWQAFFGASIGSLLFGLAAIATRGLAVPIGLHAAWNLGDWMLGGKGSAGLWRIVVDPRYERRFWATRSITYITVMAMGIVFFWMWHRHRESAHRRLSA